MVYTILRVQYMYNKWKVHKAIIIGRNIPLEIQYTYIHIYISNKNDFNCGEDHEAYSNEESSECLLTLSSGTLLIHLTARMYSDPHWSAWKSLRFLSLYYYKVYNKYYLIIHMWKGGFYLFPLCCHGYIFKQLSLR